MEGLAPMERRLPPPEGLGSRVGLNGQICMKKIYNLIYHIMRKSKDNVYIAAPPRGGSPPLPYPEAFREGGEDGVVEGLAPMEQRLPPPESFGG